MSFDINKTIFFWLSEVTFLYIRGRFNSTDIVQHLWIQKTSEAEDLRKPEGVDRRLLMHK